MPCRSFGMFSVLIRVLCVFSIFVVRSSVFCMGCRIRGWLSLFRRIILSVLSCTFVGSFRVKGCVVVQCSFGLASIRRSGIRFFVERYMGSRYRVCSRDVLGVGK